MVAAVAAGGAQDRKPAQKDAENETFRRMGGTGRTPPWPVSGHGGGMARRRKAATDGG
jgi:hypothetical protein